jgi:sirohydrochlorin ferrochelatase
VIVIYSPRTTYHSTKPTKMPSAILLVAHGSRRAEANADLVRLAEMISDKVDEEIIEIGYLELTEPTIPDGLKKCAERGATEVAILPYFLSQGSHVSSDLVKFKEDFIAKYPEIACTVCPPIGLHDKLVELMLIRLKEVSPTL